MVLFFLRDANRGAVYIAMVSTNSPQDPCCWALEGDPVTCWLFITTSLFNDNTSDANKRPWQLTHNYDSGYADTSETR